jgi:hypothetical protein
MRDFKVWRARASGNCAGPLTRSFKVWRARRKFAGFSSTYPSKKSAT